MLAALLCAGRLLINYFSKAVCNLLASGAAAVLTRMPMLVVIIAPSRAELMGDHRSADIGNFVLAVRVAEEFTATAAAPISDVALRHAGSGFCFMSCQVVAQSVNYRVCQSNFIFASRISEQLGADITAPVGGVACFSAVRFLCIMGSKGMRLHGDDNAGFRDFIFAQSIAEIFPAGRALPASNVAGACAGGGLLRQYIQCMPLGRHNSVAQGDFVLSFRISVELAADIAAPIGGVACFGAGSSFRLMGGQCVSLSRNINRRQCIPADTLLMLAAFFRAGGMLVNNILQIMGCLAADRATAVFTFVPVFGFAMGPERCVFMGNNRSNYALDLGIAICVAEIFVAA